MQGIDGIVVKDHAVTLVGIQDSMGNSFFGFSTSWKIIITSHMTTSLVLRYRHMSCYKVRNKMTHLLMCLYFPSKCLKLGYIEFQDLHFFIILH